MVQQDRALRDLRVQGSASSSGGTFRRVVVQGECEVAGNVECQSVKVQGTFNIDGHLKAKEVRMMGTARIGGNCTVETMKVMGEMSVEGDCTAERVQCKGGFTVEGLLNAGEIAVSLYGPAKAKEIGGDSIHVKLPFRIFSGCKTLIADVIEGDDIHLEYTQAKVVRGKRVWIGAGCEIELAEYTEDFHQHKKAKVTEAKRI